MARQKPTPTILFSTYELKVTAFWEFVELHLARILDGINHDKD